MEMLQLRYFYESAMAESISKAAQKFMVPASSVSASIKRLEKELGTELFVRTGNRIFLTEKGRRLLSVVSNTLSQLDDSIAALGTEGEVKGTLSILVLCARQRIIRSIMSFYKLYPSIFFKLTFDDVPENYDRYDIIVSLPEDALDGYSFFPWQKVIIHIKAMENDPLCDKKVTLNQLRDRLFVTTNTQRGIFQIFAQACKKKGFTPKVYLECEDYICRNMVVRSGICLGLVAISPNDSVFQNVQYLTVKDFSGDAVVNIYYKEEKYAGNVKLFLGLLKKSENILN